MKIEKIKPIPKYIEKLIREKDLQLYPIQDAHVRYYSYLTKNCKELCQVCVAVKSRGKKWACKQVIVHGINSDTCFIRDIIYYWISGYSVGFYEEGLSYSRKFFEDGLWYLMDDKYFNIFCPIINIDYIDKFPEYKYSAVKQYNCLDILRYLRYYKQYPQAELLVKFGLSVYATSKQILRLIGKDKTFRKWIIKNKTELAFNGYYITTVIKAYKKNKTLKEIQLYEKRHKEIIRNNGYKEIKELFGNNLERFFSYIDKQVTNYFSYYDYISACKELNIDLTQEKNYIPHNFKRWHDIRIDQLNKLKAERYKKEKEKYLKEFLTVANKYISLQQDDKNTFIVIIAKSPAELIEEGEKLNHCVGRMNYDQKFIREESLIFFVRNKDKPEVPFVTMEYSLEKKKILQCYGESDTKPDEKVLEYVNKTWLPYANRKLKKLLKEVA